MSGWTELHETLDTRDRVDVLEAAITPDRTVVQLGWKHGAPQLTILVADLPALRRLLDRVEQEVAR